MLPMGWLVACLFVAPAHAEDITENYELSLGPVGGAVTAPLADWSVGGISPGGEVLFRHELFVFDLLEDEFSDATSSDARVRLSLDEDNRLLLDRLEIESLPLTVRVRPSYGDLFDIALLGGSTDQILIDNEMGRGFWRTYAPVTLTLVGLSNTDQDEDSKVKAYKQAGLGLGSEVLAGLAGPLGLHLRADFEARTLNRFRREEKNYVRHEVIGNAEAGLAWLAPQSSARLDAWGELLTQWETRDDDGKSGADRQGWALGVRLVLRGEMSDDKDPEIEPSPQPTPEPLEPPPPAPATLALPEPPEPPEPPERY